jgi:hypothetical protein
MTVNLNPNLVKSAGQLRFFAHELPSSQMKRSALSFSKIKNERYELLVKAQAFKLECTVKKGSMVFPDSLSRYMKMAEKEMKTAEKKMSSTNDPSIFRRCLNRVFNQSSAENHKVKAQRALIDMKFENENFANKLQEELTKYKDTTVHNRIATPLRLIITPSY